MKKRPVPAEDFMAGEGVRGFEPSELATKLVMFGTEERFELSGREAVRHSASRQFGDGVETSDDPDCPHCQSDLDKTGNCPRGCTDELPPARKG